jgi:hypothetical protein
MAQPCKLYLTRMRRNKESLSAGGLSAATWRLRSSTAAPSTQMGASRRALRRTCRADRAVVLRAAGGVRGLSNPFPSGRFGRAGVETSGPDGRRPAIVRRLAQPRFRRFFALAASSGDHRAATLEIAVDLLPAPAPGMMFAHQGCGGVDGALIVRALSILVETLSQIRNRPARLHTGRLSAEAHCTRRSRGECR